MREHYSVILHNRNRKADLNRSKILHTVLIYAIIIHVFHIAYTKKIREIKNTKLTGTESNIIQKETKAKYHSQKRKKKNTIIALVCAVLVFWQWRSIGLDSTQSRLSITDPIVLIPFFSFLSAVFRTLSEAEWILAVGGLAVGFVPIAGWQALVSIVVLRV